MSEDYFAVPAPEGQKCRPPGPRLAWDNRRTLAGRLRWPEGVLEACEAADRAHPGWVVFWRGDPLTPDAHPAGFFAHRDRDGEYVCGATVEDLAVAIAVAPGLRFDSRPRFCCSAAPRPAA